jgi:hypothetical protein
MCGIARKPRAPLGILSPLQEDVMDNNTKAARREEAA